jgi:osmoprotectant transport system substrate-binding protein
MNWPRPPGTSRSSHTPNSRTALTVIPTCRKTTRRCLRYSGLESGDGDVGVGFTTDGQLTSDQLVVMKDPKSIWPFYYPAPVVRSDVLEKHPEIRGILNEVSASLSVETMRELNGQVDLDQEDPEDVARQHLEDEGIIE